MNPRFQLHVVLALLEVLLVQSLKQVELCALFRTLMADLDGVYDPGTYNDRLLLGLKGTMSEAELHILKQRMYQGRLNKARRGELAIPVPTGYVRRPSGEVAFDTASAGGRPPDIRPARPSMT